MQERIFSKALTGKLLMISFLGVNTPGPFSTEGAVQMGGEEKCFTFLSDDPLFCRTICAPAKIFRADDHRSGRPLLGLVIQCMPLNKYCTPFRLAIPD